MSKFLSAALGLTGALAGTAVKGLTLSKQSKELNKQLDDLDSWYKRSRSEDLVDSSQVKNVLRDQKEQQTINNKELTSKIAKGSLTPEKEVALASAGNVNWGDNIAAISRNDTARQQQVESDYVRQANAIYNNIYSNNNSMVGTANEFAGYIYHAF